MRLVRNGLQHQLARGVPHGLREVDGSDWLHDDLLVSAVLCAVLDDLPWSTPLPGAILQAADPLKELDCGF